jgi:hypothetical protein
MDIAVRLLRLLWVEADVPETLEQWVLAAV